MPGLIGFAGKFDPDHAQQLIQEMAKAMKDQDWYQSDLYVGDGYGLGRVSTGLLNPESQPIWNEDKTMCIVMEGELYDYQNLKQELIMKGHRFEIDNDAEFILHLFEEYGRDFVINFNGVFVAAIWNQREKELVLLNDRLGLRPLYYASYNGRFTFASGVRALLADPAFPRKIDVRAMRQMLSFEYVLGNRTLMENALLLPPASILTFSERGITIRPYWNLTYPEVYPLRSPEEYIEGLIFYLRQAVKRQLPGNLSAGLNLSGGLDSRMLLGLIVENQSSPPLRTYTFGIPGCDDVRFGGELARAAGVAHTSLGLKPDYLLEVAEKGVRMTDGLESCVHMHALANLEFQSSQVQMLYTGFLIDYLINSAVQREWLATFDRNTVNRIIFDDINILFRNFAGYELYTDAFLLQTRGAIDDDFNDAVTESESVNFLDWMDKFHFFQRQRRFTKQGDELLRSRVVCRTPFCDNDLIDYCHTIPPGLRLHRYIFIEALVKLFFPLAKVPWDKTGMPLVPCGRGLFLQFDQQARWQLQKYGIKIPNRKRRSYADYGSGFRTELRGWMEDILLAKQSLGRGYYKETALRDLISAHSNGQNYSAELGVMLTLELWHRQYID